MKFKCGLTNESVIDEMRCFAGKWAATFCVEGVSIANQKTLLGDPRFCWRAPRACDESPRRAVNGVDFGLDVVFVCVRRAATTPAFEPVHKFTSSWLLLYPYHSFTICLADFILYSPEVCFHLVSDWSPIKCLRLSLCSISA